MSKSKFYVTTPIYYVNDSPHIGHAYTTILADVLARFNRLCGTPTFFLTGTDEHGQKVQRAAEKANVSPQQHADSTVIRFQELWEKLGISNDAFIRTTEERHKSVVRGILTKLHEKGEIYKADYDGWYCVPCERFHMDKDAADSKCVECSRQLDRITESNYFFRMSAYQEWLVKYIEDHPKFIQPDFRRNETLGFLKKPLNDLCISRPKSRLAWGIELPFDSDFVTYVWFDALINYISAIGYSQDDKIFRKWWPASCQMIGKDILTTHTVYWPTMLKAMRVEMPETIFAHGWWLAGEDKMSKSAGNVVNPMAMIERYGVDAFRYFLMAEMNMGQDCAFTEEAFVRRCNADLANDLGNLLSRVMKLIGSYCDGKIPAPAADAGSEEAVLRQAAVEASQKMRESMTDFNINTGTAAVCALMREANRYLELRQPWTLAKQEDKTPLHTVLYHAAETLRIVSGLLFPIMPDKMTELRKALGLGETAHSMEALAEWGGLKPGNQLGKPTTLFPRIKTEKEPPAPPSAAASSASTSSASTSSVSASSASASAPEGVAKIEYADFAKVQLKTAQILAAEKVAGADKLLRLDIEVDTEKRQLVAGIALHYQPEQLIGRTIVIVANLKPAKIRGVESNGMLLAASHGKDLRLLTVDGDLPSGSGIK